jgi:hypothetical protein
MMGMLKNMWENMLKKMIGRKPASKRSAEEDEFMRTYGGAVDFIDRETIAPLVSYAREVAPQGIQQQMRKDK